MVTRSIHLIVPRGRVEEEKTVPSKELSVGAKRRRSILGIGIDVAEVAPIPICFPVLFGPDNFRARPN